MSRTPTAADEDQARVRAVAETLCRYPFAVWHYGDSVGYEGLLAASDLLGDGRYEGYVHGAIKAWIPRAEPFRELDNTAPGHAICLTAERTRDEAILPAAERLAAFLMQRPTLHGCFVAFAAAPLREPYGDTTLSAAERDLLRDPGPGVFVDCLHFDAPFLVHLGRLLGKSALVDCGASQAVAMIDLLQDPATGVFAHFALERTGETYGHGWSRGQGWALLGMLDVLEWLPPGHRHEARIRTAAARLAAALVETQDRSGHWPGLVQEPDTFLETSAAFFFADGLCRGVASGLFPAEWLTPARRAFAAGLAAVRADGSIDGVSAAVWACTALGHYRAVPTGFQVPWGHGPFLLAARSMRLAAHRSPT
jgi:unsaturated rhamnogalacturonyl hydrolase